MQCFYSHNDTNVIIMFFGTDEEKNDDVTLLAFMPLLCTCFHSANWHVHLQSQKKLQIFIFLSYKQNIVLWVVGSDWFCMCGAVYVIFLSKLFGVC